MLVRVCEMSLVCVMGMCEVDFEIMCFLKVIVVLHAKRGKKESTEEIYL